MNPESSDNFEQLRRILTLKRHEQPPPGFFLGFSARVIRRLQHLEEERSLHWWERFCLQLNLRPAYLSAVGVVLFGLLSAGVIVAVDLDSSTNGSTYTLALQSGMPDIKTLMAPEPVRRSTDPVISLAPSPFERFGAQVQPASFQFGN